MTDLLVVTARVQNAIALGEGHFREFKSAYDQTPPTAKPRKVADICRDIARTLVAFANADGGDLLIGVEDDGIITGVPHEGDELKAILAAPNTHVMNGHLLSMQHQSIIYLHGKRVLLFSVMKASDRIFQTSDGRTVKRDGLQTIPVQAEVLIFRQQEQRSRVYDSEFVDGAQVSHLNLDLLGGIATRYLQGMTPELYLQQMGFAEYATGGLRLRRAAVLLFAREISEWHARCQVRILRVSGTELKQGTEYNVTTQETVTGNVFELLISAWEALRPFLSQSTALGPDARFQQRYLYPELACREALINAITHRDYTIQNSVDVFVYDDHMEIQSPGSLLSTVTVPDLEALAGTHESRNPLVAKGLREAGFVQELGEGMRRIFRLMEESALELPRLVNGTSTFSVVLFHRSVFSEQQLAWLKLFAPWDLSKLQQRIVVAGMYEDVLSPDDIYTSMNTRDRDTYDREVTYLRRNGLLLEILDTAAATRRAKQGGQPKGKIGRFLVANPNKLPPNARVRVTGLPPDISEDELRAVLAPYGEIAHLQISKRTGRGSSSATVTYSEERTAEGLIDVGTLTVRGKVARFAAPPPYTPEEASKK